MTPSSAKCLRSTLEVALSAEQEVEAVLIPQLVHGGRLGNCCEGRSNNRSRVLLVDPAPSEVTREHQVLHRGPASDDTCLNNVEVGVAGASQGQQRNRVRADGSLAVVAVPDSSVSAIDASVPVGIPVVGVTPAEPPGPYVL